MGLLDRFFGPPSAERFASELIRRLREAGEQDELRYEAAENRILHVRDGQVVGAMNLHNMYRTYCEKPRGERAAYLRLCVRGALAHRRELPEDFDSARPDLRPKLWSRAALEKQRLRGRLGEAEGVDPPCIPIGEHLLAFLAYDWPESVQSLSSDALSRWGVTLYEAMEAARQNLEESTSAYARIGERLYAFLSGDNYDAARLLLIPGMDGLEFAGRPVAMVPNRDALLVAGSEDAEGLALLAELAAKGLEESYALSGMPLILDDEGAWSDWLPPEDHPLHRRFRDIELRWIGPEYAEQKQLLDALHARVGEEVFVSSFSAVEKKGEGELVSYCVWGEGVDSLLPVTQKVVFMRQGGEGPAALADWRRVVEVAGPLMEPTDHYPARFRVRQFPDESMLTAIGLGQL